MGELQPTHWLLVAIVVLLLFGGTRVASIGRGLGEGIRNFKDALKGEAEKPALPPAPAERERADEPAQS